MFKDRKIGSSPEVAASEKRMLRMLRPDQAFQISLTSAEGIDQESVCEASRKGVRTAMMEAEHNKAKALVAFHNNQRFY